MNTASDEYVLSIFLASSYHGAFWDFTSLCIYPGRATSQHLVLVLHMLFSIVSEVTPIEAFSYFPNILVALMLHLAYKDGRAICLPASPHCVRWERSTFALLPVAIKELKHFIRLDFYFFAPICNVAVLARLNLARIESSLLVPTSNVSLHIVLLAASVTVMRNCSVLAVHPIHFEKSVVSPVIVIHILLL